MSKLHIKKGDTVYVNAGEDKGKTGRVLKVLVKEGRAFVEGINMVSKSTKPNAKNPQGGIVKQGRANTPAGRASAMCGCAARATAGTSSRTSSGRCAATRSSARPCRRATIGPRRTSCARRSRCRRRSGSLWTQNNKKPPLSCSTGAALHLLAAQRQKSSFRSRYCGGRGYCMRRK